MGLPDVDDDDDDDRRIGSTSRGTAGAGIRVGEGDTRIDDTCFGLPDSVSCTLPPALEPTPPATPLRRAISALRTCIAAERVAD